MNKKKSINWLFVATLVFYGVAGVAIIYIIMQGLK